MKKLFLFWFVILSPLVAQQIRMSMDTLCFITSPYRDHDTIVIYNYGNSSINIDSIKNKKLRFHLTYLHQGDLKSFSQYPNIINSKVYPLVIPPNDSVKIIVYLNITTKIVFSTSVISDSIFIFNSSTSRPKLTLTVFNSIPLWLENSQILPTSHALSQNYPNPFNPSTTIKYSIPNNQFVTLKIFDMLGRDVTTLVNQAKPAGNYEVKFDGSNLSNGVYFYTMFTSQGSYSKKMLLIK